MSFPLDQNARVAELEAEREALRRELAIANARYDELRHRVKNEFQVFLSSFRTQARKSEPPVSCSQCVSRMWSLTALHEALDPPSTSVEMAGYLHSVTKAFETALGGPVDFITSVPPDLYLDTRRATYLGQLFCEAAMNAIKHGFPDGASGHLVTNLRHIGDNNFELTIANDGVVLDVETVPPSGFRSMKDIASQMKGELQIESMQKGMQVRFKFTT